MSSLLLGREVVAVYTQPTEVHYLHFEMCEVSLLEIKQIHSTVGYPAI